MGSKGIVASTAALAVLLQQGIGDTIRVSLTPEPNGDRTREVIVAQEILQTMGLRSFSPLVSACPGCGRTTSAFFQELADNIQTYLRAQMPQWRKRYPGVEKHDRRGDGLRRERPRRIEDGEHRHQPARHRRDTGRAGLRRRPEDGDAERRSHRRGIRADRRRLRSRDLRRRAGGGAPAARNASRSRSAKRAYPSPRRPRANPTPGIDAAPREPARANGTARAVDRQRGDAQRRRFSRRRRRDGCAHARLRLDDDATRSAAHVDAEPAHRRAHHARFALRDVDAVGSRPDVLLQRCVPSDRGHQARLGARRALGQGVGRNLAGYRSPDRARAQYRRSDMGRRAAAVSRAQRLSRGDVSHVFLQSRLRRRCDGRGHAVRGDRGHRAAAE